MRSITCFCEHTFDADLPEEIDLDREPAWLESIISGDFFKITCPNCGKVLKPDLETRLRYPSKKLDLVLIPELERTTFYRGQYKLPAGVECVIGFPELQDRVRAVRDGFDYRAVEIMKHVYLTKAEESDPDADASVYYRGKEADGALCFHVFGLSSGKVAVVKAPLGMYELVLRELPERMKTEPYSIILQPPYVSVKRFDMVDL